MEATRTLQLVHNVAPDRVALISDFNANIGSRMEGQVPERQDKLRNLPSSMVTTNLQGIA